MKRNDQYKTLTFFVQPHQQIFQFNKHLSTQLYYKIFVFVFFFVRFCMKIYLGKSIKNWNDTYFWEINTLFDNFHSHVS